MGKKKAPPVPFKIEINPEMLEKMRAENRRVEERIASEILGADPAFLKNLAGGDAQAEEFVSYLRGAATRVMAGEEMLDILSEKEKNTQRP
jgi:hypothetical protein